jgi:serine/threonine protein kinase
MPTRLRHVQELFEAALARERDERPAFLDHACGDDVELRAEVETLLEHDQQAGEGFMRPAEPPPGVRRAEPPDGPDPLISTKVGNYRIKSVIGVGGMGTVYLAEQEHPHRDVALKVMRAGVASRSVLRRFEYEAEILARLRHPNIAQVYEAGVHRPGQSRDREGADMRLTEGGWGTSPAGGGWATSVPYFAMEYIPDAKPITTFAEDNGLGTRERLKLFAQVCDAVHHGHQRGVIHRDIKPGNILVDSSGQVKIIDFGVARATDSDMAVTTQQTGVGDLIGTLQYMSPEQCAADPHDLDTRSDVYALGVVLYELLCGKLPYDLTRTPIPVAPRVICDRPPIRPSTIDRRLRGDLEVIVLKALEKDREQRYQSAASLARDIGRFLNHDPIEARPPTPWTRAVRWVGRHPVATTTTACLGAAVVVVLATIASVWYANKRPYEAVAVEKVGSRVGPAGYETRLLSISHGVLHTWDATAAFAHLVERPGELGGGRLAVVGFGRRRDDSLRGALCGFDVGGDLNRPVWQRRVEADDMPGQLRDDSRFIAEQFTIQDCWVFDVFPGRRGRELVAVFGHASSKRVIRIYDLGGKLLYQVWHDGSLPDCYWMRDAGLLVFSGDCHGPFWDGDQPKQERFRALVAFAIRPKLGAIEHDYLRWQPTGDPEDPLNPAWYLQLKLGDAAQDTGKVWLDVPRRPHNPGDTVQWTMQVHPPSDATVWWVIDQHGTEVADSRDWNDTYKGNLSLLDSLRDKLDLPDPNNFKLVPFEQAESRPSQSAPDGKSDSSGGEDDGP